MKLYVVALAALALVGCTKNLDSDHEYDQLHSQALLACQDKAEGVSCAVGLDNGPTYEGSCVSYRRTQMVCHASNLKYSMADNEGLKELCADKEVGQSCQTFEVTGKPRPGICLVDKEGEAFCASFTHRGSQ